MGTTEDQSTQLLSFRANPLPFFEPPSVPPLPFPTTYGTMAAIWGAITSKLGAKSGAPHLDGTYMYLWHLPATSGMVEVNLNLNWVTNTMTATVASSGRSPEAQFKTYPVSNWEVVGNDAFIMSFQGDLDGKALTILIKDNGTRAMGLSKVPLNGRRDTGV